MSKRALVLAVTAAATAAGCSSPDRQQITIAPPPAPYTRAVLVGPLCGDNGTCKCRDTDKPGDGGAGAPEGGRKRFELRLGPTDNELWATVDDQVLYKSKERPTDCFYIDLPSGNHKVVLRASRPGGAQAAMTISELGVAAGSWYQTFRFSCGVPGTCSHEELDEEKVRYRAIKGGLHDACGSVKIKGVTWDTGVAPDQVHPEDVAVALTLDIYKFLPGKPSGDPSCGTGSSAAPAGGAPAPEPDE